MQKKKKRQKVNPTYTCTFSFGFASDSRRLRQAMWSERMWGMQCQWKAIALLYPSWYRKASAVVVHWRCWLVQAIPRHQAQVYSKITSHACHDCKVATSKFQPFHTFQRSTKTHQQFLLVFAAHSAASGIHRSERLTTLAAGAVWSASAPIRSEIDVSSILFRELVLLELLVPPDGHCDLQLWTSLPELWVSRKGDKKNHTSTACSFVVFVESNCKLKRSRLGILLNTEEGQTWQQQCQLALWTFTWQGRTPIRLSRASSHDVTMTTCIRATACCFSLVLFAFLDDKKFNQMLKPAEELHVSCLMFRSRVESTGK